MNLSMLLTLAGPDKPGLVRDLAEHIDRCGGNWQQSRLSHLHNHFAGVVDIRLPQQHRAAFEAGLTTLRDSGLHISVYDTEPSPTTDTSPPTRANIQVVGNDRPGIVSAISQALALHGVNVEELHSDVSDAPMASGPLFQGTFTVSCVAPEKLEDAQSTIESIAHDLMIDIQPADA